MTRGGQRSSTGGAAAWLVVLLAAILVAAAGALFLAGVFDTPRLLSVTPNPARPAETVTLNGARFSSQIGDNVVLFGDKAGRIERASPTELVVLVPDLGVSATDTVRVPVRVLVRNRVSAAMDLAIAGSGLASGAATASPAPRPSSSPAPSAGVAASSTAGSSAARPPSPPGGAAATTSPPAAAKPAAPATRRSPSPAPASPSPVPSPDVAGLLHDASAALAARRYDTAVELYDDVLRREPENAAAREGRTAAQGGAALAKRAFVAGRTESEAGEGPKKQKLREFDTGDVSVKRAADVPARVDFEVGPDKVKAGDRYAVKVFLANEGKKAIKISAFAFSTVQNGTRTTAAANPVRDDVDPHERVLLYEVSETWKDGTHSWAFEAVVTAKSGDVYRNRLAWK